MTDTTLSDVRERFDVIASDLASASDAGAIRTGFAELAPEETLEALVARAQSQLIEGRSGSTRS